MALSNYYISQSIPQELVDIASAYELELILATAAELGSLTTLTYPEYLSTQTALRNAIAAIGTGAWIATQRELSKVLREAAERSLEGDERTYQRAAKAGLLREAPPLAESRIMNETLARNYSATLGRLSPVFTKAQNIPLGVLDNAYFSVQSGGASIQQAIKTAVNTLAEDGIRAAIYPSGRSMAIPEFTRMIVRTSVLQNTVELNFQRAQEYGSDLILISSHAGARPRCFPFQGRVYSMSGQHPKYPPFSSTSYGEPAGIFGISCGHFPIVFVPGLSREPTAEDRDPAAAAGRDNATEYENSQIQRYNERRIRAWKRRAESFEEAGIDSSKARTKVREWQATQRKFIERVGRTRRYDREAA